MACLVLNTFADSFILLQATDLSVSVPTIIIGHILMAFLQFDSVLIYKILCENKVNTFFASIIVGLIYSIWAANTTYGMEYAGYHFLYTFMFSIIIGELIRATKGRYDIYRSRIPCINVILHKCSYLVKKLATYSQ